MSGGRGRGSIAAAGLLAALLAASPSGRADGLWSGTVAVVSDYVFRGVSQTYESPALQGGVNFQSSSGWFGGAWTSNVDPYPFGIHSLEADLFAGFAWPLAADWSARASYTHYQYLWDRRRRSYAYDELALTLGYQDRLALTVSYQPDETRYSALGLAHNRPAAAYELSGRWPLPHSLALTGGVGYYDLTRLYGVGYWSGSAGLAYVRGRLEVDLTRFSCDGTVRELFGEASADGHWVAAVVWRF